MTLKPKERILKTATDLFLRDGYHATGIDTIVAEAGVAKMTLYKHFKSKEELIIEVLKARDESWRAWFTSTVERLADTPQDRLLAMFDALQDWFDDDDFHGCAFINAAAEFSNQRENNAVLSVAVGHTQAIADYVRDLAVQAKVKDADALTTQLCLLLEGSIVMALIHNHPKVAQDAKQAAKSLLGLFAQ
jgi:AcrR family transcriptional regulator